MRGSLDSSKNNMCNAYKTKKKITMDFNTITCKYGRLGTNSFMKTLKFFLLKDNSGFQAKGKLESISSVFTCVIQICMA